MVTLMKLYIKRGNDTENIPFVVYDELANEKYFVKLDKTHPLYKLSITLADSKTVCKIRQLILPGALAFSIKADSRNARLVLNKNKSSLNCAIYGINWHIDGNIFTRNYNILDVDNSLIATHSRSFTSTENTCELCVEDDKNSIFCVASAICISMMNTVDNLVVLAV